MRNNYVIHAPVFGQGVFYDLAWMKELSNVIGFMEAPIDGGFIARSVRINKPYRESITAAVEGYGEVAPYCASTVKVWLPFELTEVEILVFRFGFR